MRNTENIEQLFKDTFEHYEADVNPSAWTQVQGSISSSAGSAASSAATWAVVGKIAAGAVSIAVVAGSIWYVSSRNNGAADIKTPEAAQTGNTVITKQSTPNNHELSEASHTLSNSQASKQTASGSHESKVPALTIHQPDHTVPVPANETATEQPVSENAAVQQPAPKYGNATQGDGGLIRWNKPGHPLNSSGTTQLADAKEEDAVLPTANIFVNTTSGDAPLTVDFLNQGTASSLNWDFDDGSSSREPAPSHTFAKAGTYVVSLHTKNPVGEASDKITIVVNPVSEIRLVANIFTPNGDGDNDLFFPILKNISSVGVVIFSPKHGIVCEWNSLDGSWNGKLKNGEDAPEGIYFYTIQANGIDGIPHTQRGEVTLKRH